MGIEGLMKIGIATKDLDKTTFLLADVLGVVPGEAYDNKPSGMRFRLLQLEEFYIEVMEPVDPNGPIARFIEQHGEGLQHMTFKVSNIEAVDGGSQRARAPASLHRPLSSSTPYWVL